ncbi:Alpha/Beta hydrolase protein [Talaromyces proteolyticus]|uniref:Alpha/Beta hydrolase protein n=1 Tax=Talaromyces proteolyticus TaxID=1131652 RepID=A0AAD4KF93_9EURO|nr:Alpha/Beta hydrolase protein [Talaromyces proteolyticus]KAH8690239.1 Alpha/Beta hydrolase protein [Talaromyces proteolyticus]
MAELTTASKPSIVLIHGLWMTPLSWEHWIPYLEAKGYNVLAPGWPGVDERTPEQIREDPKPIADKTIDQIVDHYASIIAALPLPPIIIGHSFGGLFTQVLLSRGYGCAGIALCPAQPTGIFGLPFSTIKATIPVLSNPFNVHSTVKITAEQFHYCFGNHMTREASDVLYNRYAIPSVAHVLWQEAVGMLKKTGPGQVDFGKQDRAPLLLVAGTKDHLVSQTTALKGFEAYQEGKSNAVVEMKVFEGRSHGIVNQDKWEKVADFSVAFAEKNMKK